VIGLLLRGRALKVAVAVGVKALRDPRVRQQLSSLSGTATERVREWRAERDGEIVIDEHGREVHRSVAGRVRAAASLGDRLELRLHRLEDTLDLLRREAGPEVAAPLDAVDDSRRRLAVALAAARNLPSVRRVRAELEIGSALGKLEDEVFGAALGTAPSD
jgi:hypothetical protein